ncbi:hypothetical protein GDO86_014107 [Hymenochirus boettgeri]|nr:hypothetical protein GDO86_014107 [Hymenochirus boettgeri]
MGFRKRGPKAKHLVSMASFARRSNMLSGLQDCPAESRSKLDLGSLPKSQTHQYQLNSKKHHQYQPNGKDHIEKHHPSNKRKYYYQLNSKKHHHYQPDPKMYEQYASGKDSQICSEQGNKPRDSWTHTQPMDSHPIKNGKDSIQNCLEKNGDSESPSKEVSGNGVGGKMKIVKNKNKNGRIVIVMSKYMENGMQSVKIKSSEEPCDVEEHGRRTEAPSAFNGDRTCKTLEDKTEHWKKRVESRIKIDEGKINKDRGPVQVTGLQRAYSATTEPLHDQPLQLTTKNTFVPASGKTSSTIYSGEPPKDNVYNNPRKRYLSEVNGEKDLCKKTLTSRSVSFPGTLESPGVPAPVTVPPPEPDIILLDSDLDEPIDLRCVKTRCDSDLEVEKPEVQVTQKPQSVDAEVCESEFKPFFGNIVITDVTANCLTVTFKEYITV